MEKFEAVIFFTVAMPALGWLTMLFASLVLKGF